MSELSFTIKRPGKPDKTIAYPVDLILCFGFAGRDQAKVQEHIDELRAIGVECPTETPVIYPAAGYLATSLDTIQVLGKGTGPEVEFAFVPYNESLLIGLASDHTDRDLEKVNINKSKQICQKIISTELWDYEDLVNHWDRLELRGWIGTKGEEKLYHDSLATALLPLEDLIERANKEYELRPGTIVLSGTVPAIGGMATPERFEASLVDPVLGREIRLKYTVQCL
ncbi:MAG: DUF2848 family protein [bacterium]|jgi:hypothetical protein